MMPVPSFSVFAEEFFLDMRSPDCPDIPDREIYGAIEGKKVQALCIDDTCQRASLPYGALAEGCVYEVLGINPGTAGLYLREVQAMGTSLIGDKDIEIAHNDKRFIVFEVE
jgi:hypothetical protein